MVNDSLWIYTFILYIYILILNFLEIFNWMNDFDEWMNEWMRHHYRVNKVSGSIGNLSPGITSWSRRTRFLLFASSGQQGWVGGRSALSFEISASHADLLLHQQWYLWVACLHRKLRIPSFLWRLQGGACSWRYSGRIRSKPEQGGGVRRGEAGQEEKKLKSRKLN